MPALLVDTNTRPASSSVASTTSDRSATHPASASASTSASPDRPPVSPITPTASVAQLATAEPAEARPRHVPPPTAIFRPQPPSVAISETDNPDAIALRSAISLLQLQREKSKRDLKALQELKAVAVSDPQAFARSLQEQRAQAPPSPADILTPTLTGLVDSARSDHQATRLGQPSAHGYKDSVHAADAKPGLFKLASIPQPQNIVRCPSVNWAKYHIVGESLDKMHEEQGKWPGASEPPHAKSGARAPPHAVTAPFSPFTDGLSQSPSTSQPSKGFKKPS